MATVEEIQRLIEEEVTVVGFYLGVAHVVSGAVEVRRGLVEVSSCSPRANDAGFGLVVLPFRIIKTGLSCVLVRKARGRTREKRLVKLINLGVYLAVLLRRCL